MENYEDTSVNNSRVRHTSCSAGWLKATIA